MNKSFNGNFQPYHATAKRLLCGMVIVFILCASGCTWLFAGMRDEATAIPHNTSIKTPNTTVTDNTEDTRNPIHLFYRRYVELKSMAVAGIYDSVYNAVDFELAQYYMSFLSHDNEIMIINASAGMLYNYDNGWSGTITGAYAGTGSIRLIQEVCYFEFHFATGFSIAGSLQGDMLKCDMLDDTGAQECHAELIFVDGNWLSMLKRDDECSLLCIDANRKVTYMYDALDSFNDFDITMGLDAVESIPLFRLVYKNGNAAILP